MVKKCLDQKIRASNFFEARQRLRCGKRQSKWARLVLHERMQQRTAEQFEDAPQHPEETVAVVGLARWVTLVPRESEVGRGGWYE